MKLLRYGQPGLEKPGMLDRDGRVRDLSGVLADIDTDTVRPAEIARLRELDVDSLPVVTGQHRIGPCVADPSKIVCVGLNYRDHAKETGKTLPTEPVLFTKATTSLSGPDDDVMLPREAEHGDWEVELGIVIGRKAQYVAEENWLDYVAGFCVVNDVSERNFQVERGGQWVKGKSADTFCPLGPWLVTPDEVPDPQALTLRAEISGEVMQDGSTADMVFGCAHIVSYISRFMTLLPGDVIATGTPAGVGFARKRFLRPGDTMRMSVQGLGEQHQRVIAFDETLLVDSAQETAAVS